MLRYIVRRLLTIIPMLLIMSLLTFVLMQKTSGSYFETLKLNPQISPETIERYIKLYQLDKPLLVQYFSWLKNIFHFEFGYSFFYNIPVASVIGGRLWNTFVLSFASLVLTWGVAIPLGIYAALHRNKLADRIVQLLSYVALASPTFFVGMLFLYFASQGGVFPLGGMHSANYDQMNMFEKLWDLLRHLAIPTTALSISSIGALQRIMRGNMLEVLGQQYILTARAKGLPENRVIYSHALRNAINPLVTILGYEFAGLLSGAALLEIICNWPGLGALMLTAVQSKDIYLVLASFMMGGLLLVIGNLFADILLVRLDPRIRYEK
jgi:peptide/nickel transport system permease protein